MRIGRSGVKVAKVKINNIKGDDYATETEEFP